MPGEQARHEFAAQLLVVEARAHQLHQQPDEAGAQVLLVEVAGLLPLLAGARRSRVHARLAVEQLLVGFVEHRQHQLLLAVEVVADERVIDARVAGDVAHVEVGVADLDEPVARCAQDRRTRRRAVGRAARPAPGA